MKKLLLLLMLILILIVTIAGCSSSDVPPPSSSLPEKTRAISVFYSTGNTLVEEKHIVKDDFEIIKTTLNEMLKASPKDNTEIAIVQPECKVRTAFVDKKGVAIIDFSKDILLFDAEPKEKILAYAAIMQTLKQFKNVKAVKFLVEGKDQGNIAGKDIVSFWGNVSLKNQPFPISNIQPKDNPKANKSKSDNNLTNGLKKDADSKSS